MTQRATVQAPTPGIPGSIGAVRGGGPDLDAVLPGVDLSIRQARQEVDDACEDMEQFHSMEPDEIMRRVAGHSARLSFIRVRVMRIEDYRREWKDLRTRELEPALAELLNQYNIASRLHSVREFDYKVETGER